MFDFKSLGAKRIATRRRSASFVGGIAGAVVLVAGTQATSFAQVVYSSNFATGTTGFTAGGDISSLATASLPTDGGGITSVNQSTWLGKIGDGVAKSSSTNEVANLNLTGLTTGKQYTVAFQLFIGSSWDGGPESPPYGPDGWNLTAGNTTLINTTFSNGIAGFNVGADSRQNYSSTTYTSALSTDPLFAAGTGAAVTHIVSGSDYSQDYTIYNFGINSGDPVLTFFATGANETLQFERTTGANTDSPDEYWALNNVKVSGIGGAAAPEPGVLTLFLGGLAPIGALARRRRRS